MVRYKSFQTFDTINQSVLNASFPYLQKTSENRKVSLYCQGVEKGCNGNKWVNGQLLWKVQNMAEYIRPNFLDVVSF